MTLDSLDNLDQAGLDKDVRDFLMIEQQKAILQAQVGIQSIRLIN